MLSMTVVVSLFAAVPTPVKLASPGLGAVDISAQKAEFFSEYLGQQIVELGGSRIISASDVQALLGIERQRQLLGCADSGESCIAELGGALGVDGLILGSIARIGRGYAANLKIVAAGTGETITVMSTRVDDEDALMDWLTEAAKKLSADAKRAFRPAAVDAPAAVVSNEPGVSTSASSGGGSLTRVIVPAVAGGALLIGGGVLYGMARGNEDVLRGGKATSAPQAEKLASDGSNYQKASFGLAAAGVISLGVSGVLFALTPKGGSATIALSVGPGYGAAALQGTF